MHEQVTVDLAGESTCMSTLIVSLNYLELQNSSFYDSAYVIENKSFHWLLEVYRCFSLTRPHSVYSAINWSQHDL